MYRMEQTRKANEEARQSFNVTGGAPRCNFYAAKVNTSRPMRELTARHSERFTARCLVSLGYHVLILAAYSTVASEGEPTT